LRESLDELKMNRVYYQVYCQSKMTDRCIVQDRSSLAVYWFVKRGPMREHQ
jgi:hypothetical protein